MFIPRDSLRAMAVSKLDDAQLLLDAGRYSSAYYLAGYAVEFGFKAVICRQFVAECFPDPDLARRIYTHDLSTLMKLSGLPIFFEAAIWKDPLLAARWSTVSQWSEASRYEMIDASRAEELVAAVGDPDHGVLQWLKNHW